MDGPWFHPTKKKQMDGWGLHGEQVEYMLILSVKRSGLGSLGVGKEDRSWVEARDG